MGVHDDATGLLSFFVAIPFPPEHELRCCLVYGAVTFSCSRSSFTLNPMHS